ncbi:MAG: PEGA domain-containing protein [Sandaracinaceae bacterium]|nr:PEGA domain-containing protein [Sandaracinaceae bacterium]
MVRRGVFIAGVWLALVGAAVAQDASIEEGLRLRQEGRDTEAVEVFRRVYERDLSARALAQLALAEQALGRWVDAEAHLADALSRESDPWIAGHRAVLASALETIRGNLGRLGVDANVAGAAVTVDGRAVGTTPLAPVSAAAGTAVVEVAAEGYVRVQRSATVRAGQLTRVRVELVREARSDGAAPPQEPAPDGSAPDGSAPDEGVAAAPEREGSPDGLQVSSAPAGLSPLAWASVAGGALALIALAGTSIALVLREDGVQHWNDDARCPPTLPMGRLTMCADVYASWRTAEDWAVASGITAGVLALAAVVLGALGGAGVGAPADAPAVGVGPGGLTVRW